MLLGLAFIWGTSFILMKRGLESFSKYQVAGFRIFIAFLVLLPFTFKHIKKINKKNFWYLAHVGFIGNAIPAFLFTTAQTKINSSLAGMLNALTPLFALILGVWIFKTRTRWLNILGVIIGFIGSLGLFVQDISIAGLNQNIFGIFVVIATFCYGMNVNVVKEKLKDLNGLVITYLAFLITGPAAGIFLLFTDFSPVWHTPRWEINFLYVAILAIFSSAVAVLGINVLIQKTSALFASSVTYIIPIFAILWGMFDGEKFSTVQIISMIVVLTGVYLVNKRVKL